MLSNVGAVAWQNSGGAMGMWGEALFCLDFLHTFLAMKKV